MSAARVLAPWLQQQLEQLLPLAGHAWLLRGPQGLGQFSLALALAQAWLCEAPSVHGACGECPSCHQTHSRTHPDLLVVLPEADLLAGEWPLSERVLAEIGTGQRKPSQEIRVSALRDAIDFAQRTSAHGRAKVVVIHPAERMNAVAASALLKTLEEPAGDTRFVLASEAAQRLLPTIRSRCKAHSMLWPAPDAALAWLAEQGLAEQERETLLRANGGRPANVPNSAEAQQAAAAWRTLPQTVARGDVSALEGLPLAEAVQRLQKICHDMVALQLEAEPRFFSVQDLPALRPGLPALLRWWKQLAQAARTADHPLQAGLALEFFVGEAQLALHSGVRAPVST